MDKLIDTLMTEEGLSESEALVVMGILGITALENVNIQEAINRVDNKLKSIAYNMAKTGNSRLLL